MDGTTATGRGCESRSWLLLAPARTPAGYRVYEASAVDRLQFIKGAQRLGLKLRDIKELLTIRDTGVCPCEPAEELLRRRLADLDAEMARLSALREQMVRSRYRVSVAAVR